MAAQEERVNHFCFLKYETPPRDSTQQHPPRENAQGKPDPAKKGAQH
jgi:hypothetical protein